MEVIFLFKQKILQKELHQVQQMLEEYIEERIQVRKDILEFRKEENFKHKEQNIELNKKALALRAYNQQIFVPFSARGIDDMCQMFILKTNFQVR